MCLWHHVLSTVCVYSTLCAKTSQRCNYVTHVICTLDMDLTRFLSFIFFSYLNQEWNVCVCSAFCECNICGKNWTDNWNTQSANQFECWKLLHKIEYIEYHFSYPIRIINQSIFVTIILKVFIFVCVYVCAFSNIRYVCKCFQNSFNVFVFVWFGFCCDSRLNSIVYLLTNRIDTWEILWFLECRHDNSHESGRITPIPILHMPHNYLVREYCVRIGHEINVL